MGTWPRTGLTTNTCLNCFGVMAKLPPMYHVITDDKVRGPSFEANTSRRRSRGALLSCLLTMLLNQLTSRTFMGLRQEFDCVFRVFDLCHSFQPIQWGEVPCDCWLCVCSHFPSEGLPALYLNTNRWMHGIFGPHSQRSKIAQFGHLYDAWCTSILKKSIGLPRSVRKNCPWEHAMVTLASFFKTWHFRRTLDSSWSGVRTCYLNIDVY